MYNALKKLIEKKYYDTKEEAIAKADGALSSKRITASQSKELKKLIETVYAEAQA